MSSDNEDSPEWTKRRRSSPFDKDPFFGDIDRVFREMEKMMDSEFKNFTEKVPKDYIKERKLPDGSTVKEFGPFVYGYSMKIGSDGKPEIQEFGNIKKGLKGPPEVKEEREPLVDVVETNGEIRVVVELPGVEKKRHQTPRNRRFTGNKRGYATVQVRQRSQVASESQSERSKIHLQKRCP